MEKYKATRNEEPVEEIPKTQEEIDNENNAKAAKAGIKVAKNAGGWVGAVATVADKVDNATGGKLSEGAGKVITKVNKQAPGGRMVQKKLNEAGESGATEKVGEVADAKSSTKGGGASGTNKSGATGAANKSSASKSSTSFQSSSNKNPTSSNSNNSDEMGQKLLDAIPKPIKIKIAISFGSFIFFIMIFMTVFAEEDEINQGATNYGNIGSISTNVQGNINTCALTVQGDKYYKTEYPQTEECQVPGFYEENDWGLEPNFFNNINALIKDAETHGCSATIISGHRTRERQAYFYNCYITKSCNNGNLAAKPGYGNHEYGIAADLRYSPNSNTCINYFHNNAANFGLAYTVRSENWHIEPIGIIYGKPGEK